MEGPRQPRIPPVVQALVVVVCVVSTGTLLALAQPPPRLLGVTITKEHWTVAWEPDLKANSTWFPQVFNCSAQVEVNDAAGNFNCGLAIEPVYPTEGPFAVVWIQGVHVQPRFFFEGWGTYCCDTGPNERVSIAVIGLPPAPGDYVLNGTILLAGSTS